MLTTDTKHKIDSARDILVGKVPDPKAQVEQITNALIYKFMDDMDQESVELGGKLRYFTNGYEKYAWTKLMDASLGGLERLSLYAEALTRMSQNPHLPQLFRDIFKDTFLPYRDPETLSLFLKQINEFTYHHSEELGNSFEYLLSVLGSQGDAGQFRTPRHIIDFIVSIVDPKKTDRILDPACGTAGFLISAYKHILAQNKDSGLSPDERKRLVGNVVGYDISPDMVKLSRVNMYLHGFPEPHINEYDTLSSEDNWDDSFDVILANPPFMSPKGGIRPHKRFSIQANRAEVLFVDYIAEHLNAHGRAGIIVPEGIIYQSGVTYEKLRRMLIKNDYLVGVISLPAGVFNPYAGVKTSILWLDKELAKNKKEIIFARVENDGYSLGSQRKPIAQNDLPNVADALKSWATGSDVKNSLVSSVSKVLIFASGDCNLSAEAHMVVKPTQNHKWPMAKLGNFLDVFSGFAFKSDQFSTVNEGLPIIRIRDIKPSKTSTYYVGEFDDQFLVDNGDLLIGMDGEFNATLWQGGKALLNQRVCRLQNFNGVNERYVFYLIAKKLKEIEASTYAVTVKHISAKQIREIEIPLPPLATQQQIVEEIDSYFEVIKQKKQEILEENQKIMDKIADAWGD